MLTKAAKIQIDYFKPTGKWYAEGEVDVLLPIVTVENGSHFSTVDVPAIIDGMRKQGIRPDLTDQKDCKLIWVVRVLVDDEIHAQFVWLPDALVPAAVRLWGEQ